MQLNTILQALLHFIRMINAGSRTRPSRPLSLHKWPWHVAQDGLTRRSPEARRMRKKGATSRETMSKGISVFGLGKVGLTLTGCLARAGHQVLGVDVNP